MVFQDYVGIRMALRAVSRMLNGRAGGRRRGRPRYAYNAGSAGIVDGAGYVTSSWVVFLLVTISLSLSLPIRLDPTLRRFGVPTLSYVM